MFYAAFAESFKLKFVHCQIHFQKGKKTKQDNCAEEGKLSIDQM